jgi:hypothetical protein
MGKEDEHLRLTVSDGRLTQDAVGWRMGLREGVCRAGSLVDLVCTLEANTWNGMERLELQVRDFRPAS